MVSRSKSFFKSKVVFKIFFFPPNKVAPALPSPPCLQRRPLRPHLLLLLRGRRAQPAPVGGGGGRGRGRAGVRAGEPGSGQVRALMLENGGKWWREQDSKFYVHQVRRRRRSGRGRRQG